MNTLRTTAWIAGASALFAGCGGGGAAEEAPRVRWLHATDVAVASAGVVETGPMVSGPLEPYRVVQVRAPLAGTVEEVFVERGSPVAGGAVLARYEQDAVRSQRAGANAAVAAARSALVAAESESESARLLHEAGAIAARDLDRVVSAAAAARAQLAAAESQHVQAEDAARRSVVRAPAAGWVSARHVNPGESVNPGQPLFTVVDVDTLELAARVPAHRLAHLAVGQPVVFALDAYPGRRFEGHVARIEPVADPATRQVGVYARLPNPGGELVGGLHATGRLVEAREEATLIPTEAIRRDDAGDYVLAVESGTVRRAAVRVGPAGRDGQVAVLDGLAAGTRVVVGPAGGIEPGTPVRLEDDLAGSPEVSP